MTTLSLYPTHTIICYVPLSSSEFQTQIQPQRPGRFSNKYPFEHGEVINYTLDGLSIHPVTTKIQASLTQMPESKEAAQEFQHEANGDFKSVTEFNGCDRGKSLRKTWFSLFSTRHWEHNSPFSRTIT